MNNEMYINFSEHILTVSLLKYHTYCTDICYNQFFILFLQECQEFFF